MLILGCKFQQILNVVLQCSIHCPDQVVAAGPIRPLYTERIFKSTVPCIVDYPRWANSNVYLILCDCFWEVNVKVPNEHHSTIKTINGGGLPQIITNRQPLHWWLQSSGLRCPIEHRLVYELCKVQTGGGSGQNEDSSGGVRGENILKFSLNVFFLALFPSNFASFWIQSCVFRRGPGWFDGIRVRPLKMMLFVLVIWCHDILQSF